VRVGGIPADVLGELFVRPAATVEQAVRGALAACSAPHPAWP
jgi:hypothetical protein